MREELQEHNHQGPHFQRQMSLKASKKPQIERREHVFQKSKTSHG